MTEPVTLTTTGFVDDPDISTVSVTYHVKPGRREGLDSLALERALLKYISDSFISWAKYCRDNGMKTL